MHLGSVFGFASGISSIWIAGLMLRHDQTRKIGVMFLAFGIMFLAQAFYEQKLVGHWAVVAAQIIQTPVLVWFLWTERHFLASQITWGRKST